MSRPFKLEAVLNHRRYREDMARKTFADAARELGRAQARLARQEKERAECARALRSKQASCGSAMEILLHARYLERLDTEIRAQRQVVRHLVQDKEKKRRDLTVRLKDRKVIEKMKEHDLADQEKEERAMEQKILSDVAISRYQRRT